MGPNHEAEGTGIFMHRTLDVHPSPIHFKKDQKLACHLTFSYSFLKLQDGLRITYFWIKEQIEKEKAQGVDLAVYGSSKVVGTQAPVQLGSLRAADGKE